MPTIVNDIPHFPLLHQLFMQLPMPILILKGDDYVVELVNDRYLKLVQMEADFVGKPLFDSLPELVPQGIKQLLDTVMQTGIEYHSNGIEPALNKQPPGKLLNSFIYQPILDEQASVTGVMVTATDVTEAVHLKSNLANEMNHTKVLELLEQKRTVEISEANEQTQQKEELFDAREKQLMDYSRSLIEASLDPLITISTTGKIMDMNKAMSTITGCSRQELIGSDFEKYFTDPEKAREIYKEVFDKGFVKNYPLVIIDGKLTDVLFNGSVYKDERGQVLGAMVVARVITEQKKYEKDLKESKILAEKETAKAESARLLAEEAVKAKQQFLSNMSHEIRTPLNAIIGFINVLIKMDVTQRQKEYLSAIKVSGDTLLVLINDILDLAKVDASKMTFEKTPFKLSKSVATMIQLFEPKLQEKNIQLIKVYDDTIPEVLLGDAARLHQVIMNLLGNAVKFTNKGSITVSVKMLHSTATDAVVEFSISDTGKGIAADRLKSIFENFNQAASNTSRLYGGIGLGLSIVKQLVELQGGSVKVDSRLDVGSTFSFSLSFAKTSETVPEQIEMVDLKQQQQQQHIKILVVEDIPLNQLLMQTLLDEFGFERDIAENGKIAIEKLQSQHYDIVLMDLQMPEMNGFEATAFIRNQMKSDIPIIAVSADVTAMDADKCKALGMNDYIAKPLDEKIVYSKIIGLVKNNIYTLKKTALAMKCTDLTYLTKKTKSNKVLMMQIIAAYLEQTPPLVMEMTKSFQHKDWPGLYESVHKMIPSFAIMGINREIEEMAKKVQQFAKTQQLGQNISSDVEKLEKISLQACDELTTEFYNYKNSHP